MYNEFYSLTEELKNILKSLYGFGERWKKLAEPFLFLPTSGSLVVWY